VYLDLNEIPEVMSLHPLWSTRPRSPVGFRRSDYLAPSDRPLDGSVRDQVQRQTGSRPAGPIRMLTNLRCLGLIENPVTFYYCFAPGGEKLEAVLAEVTNTPWGDRHSYVLDGVERDGAVVSSRREKAMHVSPLMDMDHVYALRFGVPGATLPVHIASSKDGEAAFDATLRLSRTEITRSAISRTLVAYPPMSWRVLSGIYRQAAITWLRGAPFHPRPGSRDRSDVPPGSRDQTACPL
ncbi:MAG: DUF1365 domain-containing protein, partial [Solirubrobacterales bacterium]